MHNGNYNVTVEAYTGVSANFALVSAELFANLKGDIYTFALHRATVSSFLDMVRLLRDNLNDTGLSCVVRAHDTQAAIVSVGDQALFVIEDHNRANRDPWATTERDIVFTGHGAESLMREVHTFLSERIEKSTTPSVTWQFTKGNQIAHYNVEIKRALPILPEFYPWLADVGAYQDRYMESNSSVLILLGETGTAKTSFIRSLIWRHGLSTTFTYDDDLLKKDDMFANFLTGDTDLLVLEDADIFLTDRENSGNRLMAKFLNIGDGLAAPRKMKKIIFTANILEVGKIDSALMRPGRCFDCQVFRRLTFEEACAAAKAAGISAPIERQPYSLAELFGLSKGEPSPARPVHPAFIKKEA